MKLKVYFKGEAFEYRPADIVGKLHYILYKNGVVEHVLQQDELDKRSIVSFILDKYYSATASSYKMEVLS